MLQEFTRGELIEPQDKQEAYERRQVGEIPRDGVPNYFVEISQGEKKGGSLHPEERRALLSMPAFEKANIRLGLSQYYKSLADYRTYKKRMRSMGVFSERFWEWITS